MRSPLPDYKLRKIRDYPWMNDAAWNELTYAPSDRSAHIIDIAEFLQPTVANGRQLLHLLHHRCIHSVRALIKQGASMDEQAYSDKEKLTLHPLDYAVGASEFEWSRELTQLVMENCKRPFAQRDSRPLLACAIEEPDAVSYLLERGADPNQLSKTGYTALAYSCAQSDKHVSLLRVRKSIRRLLDAGAHINTLSERGHGSSPAFYALALGRTPLVRLLLHRQANVDAPNGPFGQSVRQLAHEKDDQQVLSWITRYDAHRLNTAVERVSRHADRVRL